MTFVERIEARLRPARRKIIEQVVERQGEDAEIDLVAPYERSTRLLGRYVTLDSRHYEAIYRVRHQISKYAEDKTRGRPLNFLMQAEPGSGKSHFVKCLAQSLEGHSAVAVDYNMASLDRMEDLVQPLDAVRNLKVQDRLPILFLDEFDSEPERYPLLLPLLWDGELTVAHRNLKLGKLVIILAGSGEVIRKAMDVAKTMKTAVDGGDGKLADLLSRINGGELDIPPMDLCEAGRDRRADKVCITISLLQARFGTDLQLVPLCLLRFVATTKFRYSARSIAHLVDLIKPFKPDNKGYQLTNEQLQFPFGRVSRLQDSTLAHHICCESEDGPEEIVKNWEEFASDKAYVRILNPPIEEEEEL